MMIEMMRGANVGNLLLQLLIKVKIIFVKGTVVVII
jgi:hypothetical protein